MKITPRYTLLSGKNLIFCRDRYTAEGGFVTEINEMARQLGRLQIIAPCAVRQDFDAGNYLSERITVIPLWAPSHFVLYPFAVLQYLTVLLQKLPLCRKCFCYVPSMTPVGALGIILARLQGKKIVIVERGSIVSVLRSQLNLKLLPVYLWNWLWEKMSFVACYRCNQVFVRGRETCLRYQQKGVQAVLLSGSINAYPPFVGNQKRRREQLLFVGRLEQAKGLYVLLDACTRVVHSHPQMQLRLVGKSMDVAALTREIATRGLEKHVTIVGSLKYGEPLFAEYQRSGLIILPSFSEGEPKVLLEGMSAGCIPVGSRVGGIPDMIHDGENGRLVAVGDSAALATAIVNILDLPEDRYLTMQQEALARARQVAANNTFKQLVACIKALPSRSRSKAAVWIKVPIAFWLLGILGLLLFQVISRQILPVLNQFIH